MPDGEDGFTVVDRRNKVDASESNPGGSSEDLPEIPAPAETDQQEDPESDLDSEGLAPESTESEPQRIDVFTLVNYSLQMFITTAWQRLGLWADPHTGETSADLDQARIAIDVAGDLVGRLESAPDSVVPDAERRELKRILNDLRMNYVARRNQSGGN